MTAETSTALIIGAASAAGAAISTQGSFAGVPVPLISGLLGAAVSWGMMRVTIKTVERDVAAMSQDLRDIYTLSREISDRVSRMEGRGER